MPVIRVHIYIFIYILSVLHFWQRTYIIYDLLKTIRHITFLVSFVYNILLYQTKVCVCYVCAPGIYSYIHMLLLSSSSSHFMRRRGTLYCRDIKRSQHNEIKGKSTRYATNAKTITQRIVTINSGHVLPILAF